MNLSSKVNIIIPNFTSSGLGDRFVDVFLLAVLRECWKDRVENILINWDQFDNQLCHESVPTYRFTDILKENILNHIMIPDGIHLLDKSNSCYNNKLPIYAFHYILNGSKEPQWLVRKNGKIDLSGFYQQYIQSNQPFFSYDRFLLLVEETASKFGFTDLVSKKIDGHLSNISNFATVHIRRTDKVRTVRQDKYMISNDQLFLLDDMTEKTIEYVIKDCGISFFYLSCDETSPATTTRYAELVSKLGGNIIPKIDVDERWMLTYYDLAMMARSSIVIQSQVASGFSSFASIIGKNRLLNVIEHCGVNI